MEKLQTIKIWNRTRLKLKILAAQEDKPMTVLLEEMVDERTKDNKQDGG